MVVFCLSKDKGKQIKELSDTEGRSTQRASQVYNYYTAIKAATTVSFIYL